MNTKNKGFTLLEILLVMALIGILIGILLVAINPNRQLAQARNLTRTKHITDIYNALELQKVKNRGVILNTITNNYQEICNTGTESSDSTATSCTGKLDLRVLVTTYITSIPRDPQASTGNTSYEVAKDNKNQISIRAKNAELGQSIAINGPSDILYAKAGAFPSLDLDFASNKSLIDNVSGKNLINFTRNSIDTYVGADGLIKTAGINEPRFDHNPVTGESLGLLVEEARTNFVTYGSSIHNWSNTAGSNIVTANATTAPDGTVTATGIVPNVGSGSQMANGVSNNERVFSVFAKANGFNHVIIVSQVNPAVSAGVLFNLTGSGSVVATNYGATGYIEKLANGWYRCTMVRSSTDVGVLNAFILRAADGSTPTGSYWSQTGFTGNGTSGIYLWGAQLESGSYATSYIPTAGSTVTRSADVVSITGTNFSGWYNQSEGTFFTDMALGYTQNAGNPFTFGGVYYTTVVGEVRPLANTPTIMVGLSNSQTTPSKTAITLKSQDFNVYRNGTLTGSNSSLVYSPTGTQLSINPSLGTKGFISRLTYWPNRLPSSNLQAMTQ